MNEESTEEATQDKSLVYVNGAHTLVVAVKCSACTKATLIADPGVVAATKRGERLRVKCQGCGYMVMSAPIPKAQRVEMSKASKIIMARR